MYCIYICTVSNVHCTYVHAHAHTCMCTCTCMYICSLKLFSSLSCQGRTSVEGRVPAVMWLLLWVTRSTAWIYSRQSLLNSGAVLLSRPTCCYTCLLVCYVYMYMHVCIYFYMYVHNINRRLAISCTKYTVYLPEQSLKLKARAVFLLMGFVIHDTV